MMGSRSAMVEGTAQRLESRRLGDFVIREAIGRGGFGIVFRAEQRMLGREAVIKVLHTSLRHTAEASQRFLREARLASQLDHPYAAHVYAFGAEPDGLLWIAMELVRGTPLNRFLADSGPLPIERLVPLLERICEVVHTAHQQGIVHRDLKPANVMVISRAGRLLPKLLDFGIAKAIRAVVDEAGDELIGQPLDQSSELPTQIDPALESSATLGVSATAIGSVDQARSSSRPSASIDSHAITQRGSMIGSPPYMAPEQWVDATAAAEPADIYSLAILTYELLTGRLPFRGKTVNAYAEQHVRARPPSLGDSFPPALDAVIARALAKAPDDRYESALDFARAVREASGLDAWELDEASVDDPALEALVREAPEPIAEAAHALVSSRHAYEARDALVQLGAVILRWLGIVAVACRSRLGATRDDSARARELLRASRRRTLDPLEWLELARELVGPHAEHAEAYPLPELVRAVTDVEVERAAAEVMGVARLKGRTEDASSMRAEVAAARPALLRLLEAVRFTADCPLVVISDGRAEIRMGASRSYPTRPKVRGALPDDGAVALLDADGAPLVLLSPLVQAGTPAPGLPETIFLFAGAESGAAGRACLVAARGAERFDDALWSWLGAVVEIAATSSDAAERERSPYPGLTPFTAADADVFFGRDREIERALNRVRAEPLVAIVGASGVGKSSFVAAGLVPSLPRSWRTVTLRPGATPVAALTAALGRAVGGDYRGAGTLTTVDPLDVIARARAQAEVEGQTIVLVVDQLEELFTLCRDPEERDRFGEALADASRSALDRLRVVLTLRDDFLARANEVAGLRDRLARSVELLSIPDREALLRVVTAPAERVGYTFDDDKLPARIVDDVADAPGALALLAFTVGRLWERRDRHFHRLLASEYEELGGVGGALAQHAEHVRGQVTPGDRGLVREIFRQLVTAEGTRAVLAHAELAQALDAGDRGDAVIERLINARLLVSTEGSGGEMQIEIVHEALLEAWPRLVKWRREDAEGARLRDQLRSAAKQWDDRGRPAGLLWRDDALAEYKRWRARHPSNVGDREEAFAEASLAQAASARRRRRVGIAAAFAVLAAGLVIVSVLNQRTRAAKARTTAQLADSFVERGRRALLDGNSLDALVYLDQARRLGAEGPGVDFMTARALPALEARVERFAGHDGKVHAAVFSPDETRVLTAGADGTARLWEVASGRAIATLSGHESEIDWAAFTPSGNQIITCSYDGTAKVWDAASGAIAATLRRDGDKQLGGPVCALSSDGALLAAGAPDGHVLVWSIADRSVVHDLAGHPSFVTAVAFSPDGGRLATGSQDGSLRLWDIPGGTEIAALAHEGAVRAVAFRPDGAVLASAGWDRSVRLWDAATGASLRALVGHTESVEGLAWGRDGGKLLSASRDDTAKLWDTSSGDLLATLPHRGYVSMARFSPDGERAITASGDGSARVWELPSGTELASLEGHGAAVWVARFDSTGQRILTASWDGSAMMWTADRTRVIASLDADAPRGWIVSYLGDGGAVAALGIGGAPQIWSPKRDKALELSGLADRRFTDLLPSTSGRHVVVSTLDGGALVFETATGRQVGRLAGNPGRIMDLALSADDGRLVAMGADGVARVWSAKSVWAGGDVEPQVTLPAKASGGDHEDLNALAEITPDGRTILTVSGGVGRLWAASSGEPLTSFEVPPGAQALDVSPDGRRFVVAGRNAEAVVVDVATRRAVALGEHRGTVMSAELSPDGRRVVTACEDGLTRIFDAGTGRLLGALAKEASHVWHASWNPAGTLIAAASVDGTVTIWDAEQLTMIGSFTGHTEPVSMVAFDASGERLVSTGWDGRVRIWDVSAAARAPSDQLLACLPRRVEGTRLLPKTIPASGCRSLR